MLVKVRDHLGKQAWIETTFIVTIVDLDKSRGNFNVYTVDGEWWRISAAQAERLLDLMRQQSNEHDLTGEHDD